MEDSVSAQQIANQPDSHIITESVDIGHERRPEITEPKVQNKTEKIVTLEDVHECQSSPDSGVCTNELSKSADSDQDSDDEQLVLKRAVNKKQRIVEDDSSDEDSAVQINFAIPSATCSDADECGQEEDNLTNSSLQDEFSTNTNIKSKTKRIKKMLESDNSEAEDEAPTTSGYNSFLKNSDLFDTEEPDDQLSVEPDLPDGVSSEEEHKPEMPAKKANLKQRQSKKNEKTVKSIRQQKENLMQIHSDSQRMLRESRVVLPYHQPEHKSLNYFLNRKKNVPSKLKPTLSELKGMLKFTKTSTSVRSTILDTLPACEAESPFSVKLDLENKNDQSDDDIDLPPSGILRKVSEAVTNSQISGVSCYSQDALKNGTCSEPVGSVQLENSSEAIVSSEVENISEKNPNGHCSKAFESLNPSAVEESFETMALIQSVNVSKALVSLEGDRDSESMIPSQMEASEAMSSLRLKTDSETIDSQRDFDSEEVKSSQFEEDSEAMGPLQMEGDSEAIVLSQLEGDSEEMGPLKMEGDSETMGNVQLEENSDDPNGRLMTSDDSASSTPASPSSCVVCAPDTVTEKCHEELKVTRKDCNTLVLECDKTTLQEKTNVNRTPVLTSRSQVLLKPVLEQVKYFTPRLSEGGPSSFISLDNEMPVPISSGLKDLMHRFVKHTTPVIKHKAQPQKIELNIVKKELNNLGKEVLVADTVSVTVNSPSTPYESPIVQRELLKKVLRAKIAIRREQERQKRIQLCELDNEEGFVEKDGDQGIEEEEEEEAEMTDETETEDEEESEEEVIVRKKKKRSAFIDDEAEDDDEDEDDDNDSVGEDAPDKCKDSDSDSGNDINEETPDMWNKENICPKETESETEEKQKQEEVVISSKFKRNLTEDLFPQDYSEASYCSSVKSAAKDKSDCMNSSTDCSFELLGSEIPPYQPYGGHCPKHKKTEPQSDSETELFTPLTGFRPTQTKLTQYESQLSIHLDNTQALDGKFVKDQSQFEHPSDFDYKFPESSRLTSAFFDGPPSSHKALLGKDSQDASEGLDELLALCSGKFNNSPLPSQPDEVATAKAFLPTDCPNNMDELVGLCSGQFTGGITNDSDKEDSMLSLTLASDGENSQTENKSMRFRVDAIESENDEQEENETGEDSEVGVEEETENVNFIGFGKKGKIRREFFEDEAELSGSEMDSDENEDIPEDEDIMEEEEGDKDDVLSDDELRNQVGRVHYKTMLDEDKRDLRLFQEVFLQDGDMHNEGRGRERKFRWKDMDGSSGDGFGLNQSDEDSQDDAADQEDLLWRMQRSEREKWLCENNIDDQNEELELEGSQLLKFQTTAKRKRNSALPMSDDPSVEVGKPQPTETISSPKNIMKMKFRRGSFLTRSKETLSKIAGITKQSSDSNPNGPKHSRNFVFAAKSPAKGENVKKISRSVSDSAATTQAAKRTKYDRTFSADQSRRNSIFSFL